MPRSQGHDRRARRRRAARPLVRAGRRRARSSRSLRTPTTGCTCCATPPPTCWRRRSATSTRARSTRSARRSPTASTTTSTSPSRSTRPTSRRSTGACAQIVKREPAVRARRGAARRGARAAATTSRSRCEIIEGIGSDADETRGEVAAGETVSLYSQRRLGRPVHGPARAAHGHARRVQAHERGRRLLARRREEPAAHAHLRHRVGDRRTISTPTCTGSRRPSAATTASSAPSSTCSRSPRRSARGSRSSTRKGGLVRRLMEDYSRRRHEEAGYDFVVHAAHHEVGPVRDQRAPGVVRRRHVPADGARRRHAVLPQADELPDAHPDLQEPDPELPRAADAAVRVRHGVPLRAVRGRARAHARARAHDGRRPHLHDEGADGGGARGRCSTFVLDLLRDYGLDDFYMELSTRPEGKAVGTDEEWDEATEALRQARRGDGRRRS